MNTQENLNENANPCIGVTTPSVESQDVTLTVTATAETAAAEEAAPATDSPAEPVVEEKTSAPENVATVEETPAEAGPADTKSAKPRQKRERRPVCEVTQESLDEVKDTLQTMFRYLDLQGELAIENRGQSVSIMISSEEAGKIIGHHGNNLESLQIILNRIIQKKYNDYPKIYIDIASEDRAPRGHKRDGDNSKFGKGSRDARRGHDGERRERGSKDGGKRFSGRRGHDEEGGGSRMGRDEKLRMQAIDAAKEVRLFGEAKTLPPMNPHDRRIIHLTLENEVGIVTESIGDGDCRSVVISPKD